MKMKRIEFEDAINHLKEAKLIDKNISVTQLLDELELIGIVTEEWLEYAINHTGKANKEEKWKKIKYVVIVIIQ